MRKLASFGPWYRRLSLELNFGDLWIGAYWRRCSVEVDVYVCLLPCLALHLNWWRPFWRNLRRGP